MQITNDLVDGVSTAINGHRIVTDKDGDKIFTVYEGKGSAPGIIAGTNQWTGGTGTQALALMRGAAAIETTGIAALPCANC